jgi:hypothetical protein
MRFLVILSAAVVVLAIGLGFASPRSPASTIETALLRITPLGSSKEDVLRAIEKQGWKHGPIENVGFLKQIPSRRMEVVGKKSIEAHLGEYGFLFRTSVDAFWGFDNEGKLMDVWVWKTTDSL